MRARLVLAAALFITLGVSAEARPKKNTAPKNPAAEARQHLTKANRLAGAGKCKQAVPEFSAAYRLLPDPVILFNRAECLRKLGEKEKALADYRQFLTDMPAAPNRKTVEDRITALGGTAPVAAPTVAEPAPAPAPAPQPPPPPPPPVEEKAPPVAETPPSLPVVPAPAPRPWVAPAPRVVETETSASPEPSGVPTWVWISIGAVALTAAAFSTWYLVGRPHTEVPPSSLGNYRF